METQAIDQAPVQSMEDRIASKFGIEEDQPPQHYDGERIEAKEPEEETPVESVPDEVEIEYEGEKFRLPKKLEKAILQERDYTQKTQALSEQRKQVEFAQKALETSRLEREFHESVQQEVNQMHWHDQYIAHLTQQYQQNLQNTDPNSLEDGLRNINLFQQIQSYKEQRDALNKGIEGKRTEFQSKVKAQLDTLKSQARDLLSKQINGYSDDTAKEVFGHAKSLGYTDADVEMMELDPRAQTVLYKAMKYDQLQASKVEAVQKAVPVVKPGASNPMPQATKDKLAYYKAMKSAKTSQDKAKLIEQRLANSF